MLPATRLPACRTCGDLQLFVQLHSLATAASSHQRSRQIQLQRCSTAEGIQADMMIALRNVI
jgi:hypothetical protein